MMMMMMMMMIIIIILKKLQKEVFYTQQMTNMTYFTQRKITKGHLFS